MASAKLTLDERRGLGVDGPASRGYNQYCGLAAALDLVGRRWTLLIIRELMLRPRRFGELQAALGGLGTNLLADRLQELQQAGLITHEPVNGGRRQQYVLTETGEELRESVLALARWGLKHLWPQPAQGDTVRSDWAALAVEALVQNGKLDSNITEEYEFRVDVDVFHLSVEAGSVQVHVGPAERPAMVLSSDAVTFVQLGARSVDPLSAMTDGRVTVEGDMGAVLRCCALLGMASPLPVGSS